jgi:hypothetical protein
MNETMSLLLATAVLAVGGLGLYMYKNNDNQKGGDDSDHYDEDELFNTEYNIDQEEPEFVETKVRSRASKTKRAKKSGGTKRRY